MLKADVEGYEPQVMQTAQTLLRHASVENVQLELTKTPSKRDQTCATVKMLEQLHALGFDFKQVGNKVIDEPPPPVGSWRESSIWASLPAFPSQAAQRAATRRYRTGMEAAYHLDAVTHSTNLIGRRREGAAATAAPPWPTLGCG